MNQQQYPLSDGVCLRYHRANPDDNALLHTTHALQVLEVTKDPPRMNDVDNYSDDQYRVVLSDGSHFVPAVLNHSLNYLVHHNVLGRNTVIALDHLFCIPITGGRR
ncbi:hypothetical protein PLICRDRAFT_301619 [Plicaturopsis crispa FD-325 SS-3]|nr:hypothetical protein PLICRDRAFT_301619 [Plicaturopsis crispa FD-325 SS-3]